MNTKTKVALVLVVAAMVVIVFIAVQRSSTPRTPVITPLPTEKDVTEIGWNIDPANPEITDSDDYRMYEETITLDVYYNDETAEQLPIGNAYGCTGTTVDETDGAKRILGRVSCYYALSGTSFVAYTEGRTFKVERFDEDASGETAGKTTVVVEKAL